MLRKAGRLFTNIHRVIDLLVVSLSFYLSFRFFVSSPRPVGLFCIPAPKDQPNVYLLYMVSLLIYHFSFYYSQFYAPYRYRNYIEVLLSTARGVITGSVLLFAFLFVVRIDTINDKMIISFVIFTMSLLAISKTIVYYVLSFYRKRGYNIRKILIVGSKKRAQEIILAIKAEPQAGYRIIGALDFQPSLLGKEITGGVKVVDLIQNLANFLAENVVDEIIFAAPLEKIKEVEKHIHLAELTGINVRVLPDWQLPRLFYTPFSKHVSIETFLNIPTVVLSSLPQNTLHLVLKTCFDYFFSLVLVILLCPLLLAICLAIKCTSPGPVLFKQVRCSLNGRRFILYKFRTMYNDAESLKSSLKQLNEEDGPVFKIRNDPRITPVGKIIRTLSLDELPQLFNVLRDEMSLVGPRPPLPEEVARYDQWQRRRLSVKPGLTCTWQVRGRNKVDFKTWVAMDLAYIDNWSLWLDIKLISMTVLSVLRRTGM